MKQNCMASLELFLMSVFQACKFYSYWQKEKENYILNNDKIIWKKKNPYLGTV